MNRLLGALSLLAILSVCAPLGAQNKIDLAFQQSPTKPAPDWLKIIDHGERDPRLKGYFAPEGLKIEIVADAPEILNPVGMTFDVDGNLYVMEWVESPGANFPKSEIEFTYKDGTKRKVAIMRKPTKDRVKLLTYNAAKGTYDKAQVILEDELPSSILVHEGWIYLTGQGTVRRFAQTKPGGPYDKKEIIAQGFCGYHHHQVSGLTIGNDGWLYITSGDDDNFVEGSDGSRATVLRTGAVFRCKLDGSKMHVHSIGYRNPYRDVVFDSHHNMFHVDNDNEDGSKFTGCRLMHVPEGVDFGWRLRMGVNCCIPDFVRGAVYGELSGKVAPMLKTGRGSPAGLLIGQDSFFPKHYQGLLHYPDVFRKVIRSYQVAPKGATFEVTHEFELLKSDDPLFRPCQMVQGPDGAMYIADWRTDSGGAGKLWGDGKNGRIYRVTWAGTEKDPAIPTRGLDSWSKIAKSSDAELLQAFESKNFTDRHWARLEIAKRGDKQRGPLLALLNDDKKPSTARITALGAVQSFWNDDVKKAFLELLTDGDANIRRLAVEALSLNGKAGDQAVHESLVRLLNEENLGVRRAMYLALGKNSADGVADVLVSAAQFDNGKDEYLSDGILRAIEATGKKTFPKLMTLADSGEAKDLDRLLDIYSAFRTREAAEQIPTLLKHYHVKAPQKAALIRSYNYYQLDPPLSLAPLAKYLDELTNTPPKDVTAAELLPMKLAAMEVLASNNAMNPETLRKNLVAMLASDELATRLIMLKAIGDSQVTSATPLLLDLLGKSKETKEREVILQTLGTLKERSATGPLEKLLAAKGTEPEVRVETLRALGSIDNRKARQLAEGLLGEKDITLVREAVVLLGQQADGAKLLGKRFIEKKLPRALMAEVAGSLRQFNTREHPDVSELLADVVKGGLLLSLQSKDDLERLRVQVQEKGNVARGRNLYLSHQKLACVTCHKLEGIGGNVGPDLTRVWDTQSLEKAVESMLDPSKEIKEGYQSFVAVTKGGQVVTGLKVTQNDKELVLRDTTGKEVRIAANDLEEVTVSKKSLMPDDVVKHLSLDEFLDLIAFLRSRPAQEELRGWVLSMWTAGPFDGDLKKPQPPEKNPDPTATYEVDGKMKIAWQKLQAASTENLLAGQTLLSREPKSLYGLAYVYSPESQAAKLAVDHNQSLRVWINGKSLDEFSRAAIHTGEVPLTKGWNTLLVRYTLEDLRHPPRLMLRFVDAPGIRVSLQKE